MILHILQIGHPLLRKSTRQLSSEEILSEPIQALIFSMCETMRAAPGVGLAAPQIGESLQLIVIEDKSEYTTNTSAEQLALRERKPVPLHILINPKITEKKIEKVEFFEACLSVEGYIGVVPRSLIISVEALNEKAEPISINARGWYARILQHEIDHLNGILCTDRMKISTLMTCPNYIEHWLEKPISETLKILDAE